MPANKDYVIRLETRCLTGGEHLYDRDRACAVADKVDQQPVILLQLDDLIEEIASGEERPVGHALVRGPHRLCRCLHLAPYRRADVGDVDLAQDFFDDGGMHPVVAMIDEAADDVDDDFHRRREQLCAAENALCLGGCGALFHIRLHSSRSLSPASACCWR